MGDSTIAPPCTQHDGSENQHHHVYKPSSKRIAELVDPGYGSNPDSFLKYSPGGAVVTLYAASLLGAGLTLSESGAYAKLAAVTADHGPLPVSDLAGALGCPQSEAEDAAYGLCRKKLALLALDPDGELLVTAISLAENAAEVEARYESAGFSVKAPERAAVRKGGDIDG